MIHAVTTPLSRSWVDASDVCVELGCAYGHCTAALTSTGAAATGVDISTECVESASATFPRCRFVCGDVLADGGMGGGILPHAPSDTTVVFLGTNRHQPHDHADASSNRRRPHPHDYCRHHRTVQILVAIETTNRWSPR